jgi:cation diffusion facilitator CzcD-associated flavoprotein CzcO
MAAETEWVNRPTFFYSFSFAPNYLSKTIFPSGRDYVEYLYSVVERAGIADKIQLNAEVTSVEWVEQDSEWELQISHLAPGTDHLDMRKKEKSDCVERVEIVRAKVVISAVGILVEPNDWPAGVKGRDAFSGQVLHSARWPAQTNLDGKDVVLVGSGCSAAQIAPALLQTNIKSLTQIIRTPPWLVPRVEEPGGKEAYAKWAPRVYGAVSLLGFSVRILLCWVSELLWYTAFQRQNVKLRQQAEGSSLAHMRALAPAQYHSMLTPTYSLGCKRRVYDNDWLRSMSDPRFTMIDRPLLSAEGSEVKVGSGPKKTTGGGPSQAEETYRADALILATGFEATQFLQPVSVIGRQGLSLHGLWTTRGGAHAYMGTALDGFPNFFMIMGPNTFAGHTSVIMSIENSIEYALRLMQPLLMGDVETVEPKSAAVQTWVHDIRRDMKKTVFEGCQSWYNGYGVYNSVMYP